MNSKQVTVKYEQAQKRQVRRLRRQEQHLRHHLLEKVDFSLPAHFDFNKDIFEVPNFAGCFTKGLPHHADGTVSKTAFLTLLRTLVASCPEPLLKTVPLGGTAKLVQPSAVWSNDICAPTRTSVPLSSPPRFRSPQMAAELCELYAMALLRDVPFANYTSDPRVPPILAALNALSDYRAPRNAQCQVTPELLFRGPTAGDRKGYYVSQFLLLPATLGIAKFSQQYTILQAAQDYMTTVTSWLAVQNGNLPTGPQATDPTPRFLYNMRAGASYVFADQPCQACMVAAWILQALGCPANPANTLAKQRVESPFIDASPSDFLDTLFRCGRMAGLASWHYKWTALRVRPEAYAFQVQQGKTTRSNPYGLNCDLFRSTLPEMVFAQTGTYLLPQAFAVGCPIHPSFPQMHGLTTGAGGAVLKAWYDPDFLINEFVPSADGTSLLATGNKVRVGDEIDKLVSNIALFRSGAGVHYRSDMKGCEVGENMAIATMRDTIKRYPIGTAWRFQKRNGRFVTITNSRCEQSKNTPRQ